VTGGDAPKPCRSLKTWEKMSGGFHRVRRIRWAADWILRKKRDPKGILLSD
jgi:hypothetical protein